MYLYHFSHNDYALYIFLLPPGLRIHSSGEKGFSFFKHKFMFFEKNKVKKLSISLERRREIDRPTFI